MEEKTTERKKSGAEKSVEKAEARAREKALTAMRAWLPLLRAKVMLSPHATDSGIATTVGDLIATAEPVS